jgi:hypothetical protein
MIKHTFLSLTLAWLTVTAASAQPADKLIKEADKVFYEEKFYEAYEKYDYIHHLYPDIREIDYQKEVAYLLSEGRGESTQKLHELGKRHRKDDIYYDFWVGRIYLSHYDFEEAKKHFALFLRRQGPKSSLIEEDARALIQQINVAQGVYTVGSNWYVERLPEPINSEYSDLSPSFFSGHDELLLVSARPTEPVYEADQYHVFHTFKKNGAWNKPTPMHHFGHFDFYSAKIEVVSADGKAFVYKDDNGGNLFYSEPTADNWTELKEFDTNLKKRYVGSHFFIDDQETTVIFASEKGGQVDLYQTTKLGSGEWSDPEPVGINTEYNEDSPYLSHDGKYLYFSSDRPQSIGGYDIFRSEWNATTGTWSTPENLGFPINTIDDEFHFQLNEDNQTGYLSSNRLHSRGDFDIYSFEFHEDKVFTRVNLKDAYFIATEAEFDLEGE